MRSRYTERGKGGGTQALRVVSGKCMERRRLEDTKFYGQKIFSVEAEENNLYFCDLLYLGAIEYFAAV